MDENPWNDKDTEDFLRHMKQEYFVFCYFLTAFILDVILYFPGKDYGGGVKDFNPTKKILLFDMFTRANNIIILIVISSLKMKITETRTRVIMGFLVIFDWIMLTLIYTTYKNSNFMEGQNMFCRVWT